MKSWTERSYFYQLWALFGRLAALWLIITLVFMVAGIITLAAAGPNAYSPETYIPPQSDSIFGGEGKYNLR